MADAFERFEVPSAVAIGGALGSLARWVIAQAINLAAFPLATFVTNLLGCFALGVVLVAGERIGGARHRVARLWRPFMATGVLGGFTTFSTFVVEVDRAVPLTALLYAVLSVGLGLASYASGNVLARAALGVRS